MLKTVKSCSNPAFTCQNTTASCFDVVIDFYMCSANWSKHKKSHKLYKLLERRRKDLVSIWVRDIIFKVHPSFSPVYSNILPTYNLPEYLVIDEVSQFYSFIMSIGQTKLKMCIEVLFTAVHTIAFIFLRVSNLGSKACFKKQYLSQGIYVSFQMMFKLCTSSVTIIS